MTLPAIDDKFEAALEWTLQSLDSFKNTLLIWGLIGINWAITGCEVVYNFTAKSCKGAIDIHREIFWVFTKRNSIPWPLTEIKEDYEYPLIYSPESNKFSRTLVSEGSSFSFDDIVFAEMKNSDSTTSIDLTSIFHNVRWTVGFTPSLYEVALVYCLKNNLLKIVGHLEDFTVEIMNAEGKTLIFLLDSTNGRAPFTAELRV